MSVDKWYDAIQAHINLTKYPQETARILHTDAFCLLFFSGMINLYQRPSMTVTLI